MILLIFGNIQPTSPITSTPTKPSTTSMYSKLIRFSSPRGVLNLVDHNWKTTQSHQYYGQKEVAKMYHRNEFLFMVLPCYPIFSLVHILLFPTYQGTSFSWYFFWWYLLQDWLVVMNWYFLQIQSLHCSIAKKHLQGQFWFSMSPRWRFCLSDVSVCTSWIITKVACTELCVGCFQLPLMHHITTHTPSLEHSHLFVFFCVADANWKKQLSHSRLPPRVKNP